jgi:predicted esterase
MRRAGEINVQEWVMSMMGGGTAGIAKLIRKVPPGLDEARARLTRLVNHVVASTDGISHSELFLGGFSQGAMTAVDVGLSLPAGTKLAGLLSISGAPIVVDQWAKKVAGHKGTPVLVTHGKSDMVLPFQSSGWLIELLEKGGLVVKVEHHEQAHTLGPQTVIASIIAMLDGLVF